MESVPRIVLGNNISRKIDTKIVRALIKNIDKRGD
jgi:hypothetical protein